MGGGEGEGGGTYVDLDADALGADADHGVVLADARYAAEEVYGVVVSFRRGGREARCAPQGVAGEGVVAESFEDGEWLFGGGGEDADCCWEAVGGAGVGRRGVGG